jgi:2-oxoisovalerate dehydrogenase E1 component
VPDDYYNLPLGKARIVQEGSDVTVVTYGAAVHWVMELVPTFPDARIEVIDLRTLLPWDKATVLDSVQKTGKCLVVHEDTMAGGLGGEIAATIMEERFRFLDAPVMRVASLDTPVPFNLELEKQFLPKNRLKEKLRELINY